MTEFSQTVESNRIEYKQELTDTLEKEVVAFLNYPEGGVIYIGIASDGSVVGVSDCDAAQLKIKDRLKSNIQPSCLGLFDIIHEKHNNRDIIKITLASGTEKPYYLKKYGMSEKGCYIRIGSASEPMTLWMIEKAFAKRVLNNSIGKVRSSHYDLTFEQLRIYYQEAGFDLGEQFAHNLELLTEDGYYNYAAYLLSDSNGNSMQVARYRGLDRVDLIGSHEFGYCSVVKTCKGIIEKMEIENRTITKITSKERITKRLWNQVALREAVINAIVHNDYTSNVTPKVEFFDDRIEISSAGSITQEEEQKNFFAGYSIPKNKILMRIFKDLDMVEYLGSGMPRILKAYPKESYTFGSMFIRAVFPISQEALELERGDETTPKTTEKKTTEKKTTEKKTTEKKTTEKKTTEKKTTEKKTTEKKTTEKKTTEKTAEKILDICRKNPKITIQEMAQTLGMTEDGIFFHLKTLREKNFLIRIGGRKLGHWEVVENNND